MNNSPLFPLLIFLFLFELYWRLYPLFTTRKVNCKHLGGWVGVNYSLEIHNSPKLYHVIFNILLKQNMFFYLPPPPEEKKLKRPYYTRYQGIIFLTQPITISQSKQYSQLRNSISLFNVTLKPDNLFVCIVIPFLAVLPFQQCSGYIIIKLLCAKMEHKCQLNVVISF